MKRFVLADVEARFHDSVKRRVNLEERAFDAPKVTAMTVVHEFYANVFESPHSSTTVKERQVRYDFATTNAFFKIHNALNGPNQVALIDDTVDLDEVTRTLCDKVVLWTMVRGARTVFLTKELRYDMKIWTTSSVPD